MWEQLTQEQRWGFEYAAKLRNDTPDATKTDWTGQEIALQMLGQIADGLYLELKDAKWNIARQMFDSAPPEQQTALLQQFGIPDVLG